MTAREEWRKHWKVPVAAGLGNTGSAIHIYSLGAFMAPLSAEFGWSRAEISSGITMSNSSAAVFGLLVGVMIDRFGPRRVGLVGVTGMALAFGLLGTATGSYANWLVLWFLVALATTVTQPTIWTSAVATRFDVSRGLALALTVSLNGAAASFLPVVSTLAIAGLGWRHAFFAVAAGWLALTLPVVFLFFRGSADGRISESRESRVPASAHLSGMEARECFRTLAFYRLGIAGGLFAFCAMALIVHYVPILADRGIGPVEAASIAGLIGLASIAGRFVTGYLLDRFRPERVALFTLALPTLTALLLLNGKGPLAYSAAAVIAGFSLGSELDVIIYLATRHFGLRRFGTVFAAILLFLTAGTATGPLTAGAIFDHFDSYDHFLQLIIPMVLLASLLTGTLPPAPDHARRSPAFAQA